MKLTSAAALLLLLASTLMAQAPCTALPLTMPLQFGETTPSMPVGTPVGSPGCAFYGFNASPERWYQWTAPADGMMFMTTCPSLAAGAYANFDTSLAVYTGSNCAAVTYQECNGDGPFPTCPFFESAITFNVICGTTYWIKINGYEVTATFGYGDFAIFSQFTPTVAPSFTLSLSAGGGSITVDLDGAPCGQAYFTAASFWGLNFNPNSAGNGWWFGLWISIDELLTQYQSGVAPFLGTTDLMGSSSTTIAYPPALIGMQMAAVSLIVDPFGAPMVNSDVEVITL